MKSNRNESEWRDSAHWVAPSAKYVSYSLTVFYFGRLIALVNESGGVVWRDPNYPLYLVEYLIECPSAESYKWS